MKRRHMHDGKRLVFKVGMSFLAVMFSVLAGESSFAVTYQDEEDVYFTFNSSLTVSQNTNSFVISNLAPGTTADSNEIITTISTNSAAGFVATATVGEKNGNTDLVHSSNSSYKFSRIATGTGQASLSADNTWGCAYATSSNNGTSYSSWSNYLGFPLDDNTSASDRGKGGTTVLDVSNYPTSSYKIKMKVGAKAGSTQPAGTYTNKINVYVVAKDPA